MRYPIPDITTPLDLISHANLVSGNMFGIMTLLSIAFIMIGYSGIRYGRKGLLSSFTILIFIAIIMRAGNMISDAIVNLVLVILVVLFFFVGIYKET